MRLNALKASNEELTVITWNCPLSRMLSVSVTVFTSWYMFQVIIPWLRWPVCSSNTVTLRQPSPWSSPLCSLCSPLRSVMSTNTQISSLVSIYSTCGDLSDPECVLRGFSSRGRLCCAQLAHNALEDVWCFPPTVLSHSGSAGRPGTVSDTSNWSLSLSFSLSRCLPLQSDPLQCSGWTAPRWEPTPAERRKRGTLNCTLYVTQPRFLICPIHRFPQKCLQGTLNGWMEHLCLLSLVLT